MPQGGVNLVTVAGQEDAGLCSVRSSRLHIIPLDVPSICVVWRSGPWIRGRTRFGRAAGYRRRRQPALREVRPVQGHDEVGAASFGAPPERRIVNGSGCASMERLGATISAASRSRFTTFPTSDRRTPQRRSTSTYSSRMAALMSHVKVSCSIHARRNSALGFLVGSSVLKPAIPATRTEMSTTPLRRDFGSFGDNRQA